ncbi:MAG TPA: hypothetical protein VGK64_16155 [Bryobacteraceae bacterium]
MACCGGQRTALRAGGSVGAEAAGAPFLPRANEFEYIGTGDFEITGPLTGKRYFFRGRGARVRVEASDVASFVSIPNLRRIP